MRGGVGVDDNDDDDDEDDEENHVSDLSPANKVPIPEPAIHPQHHSYKVDRCLARNSPRAANIPCNTVRYNTIPCNTI